MPTYTFDCANCGPTTLWRSIHDATPSEHHCGGQLTRVYTPPMTYGIGKRGARTRDVDSMERGWDRNMPAYKRLRDEGLQPPQIDIAAELEARGTDEWFVNSGGMVSVPDGRRDEMKEMLAEGTVNADNWSPIEQVHGDRA